MQTPQENPFTNSEYQINWLKLPLYLIGAALMSQLVMHLDDALMAAYVFTPYIFIQMWASDSDIKWSNNKQHFLIYVLSSVTFLLVATFFILEVLSFERSGSHSIDIKLLNSAIEVIANQNER